MSALPGGVPNLGERPMLMLREQCVIVASQVEVFEGGLTEPHCPAYLRVVDLATARAWLVPLSTVVLGTLRGDMGDILNSNQHAGPVKGVSSVID